jgi:23S rRNA pseudouridine2604 synthase
MRAPIRLAKRVIELTGCSRSEAERYIEGGWVRVNGHVVERPQVMVTDETVEIDRDAAPGRNEAVTLILHKPAGMDADKSMVTLASRWADDPSGVTPLARHLTKLSDVMPLERDASGLLPLTQDARVVRYFHEEADRIEQEFLVEVSGRAPPDALARLSHGAHFEGRALPPCKVSWQSETRLRFALKAVRPGQLRHVCADAGLEVVAMKRLRLGRISMGKLPSGTWRYVAAEQRFLVEPD